MSIVSGPGENTSLVVSGPARSDRVFRRLLKRLRPGDIAVIDIEDFDPWTANELLGRGVAGVVNLAESFSGRNPAIGAPLLLEAGVPILDRVGAELQDELQQGEILNMTRSAAELRGGVSVDGVLLTKEIAAQRLEATRQHIALAISKMATAVASRTTAEWSCYFQSGRLPALEPLLRGKVAAVIAHSDRGVGELRGLRRRLASCIVIAAEHACEDTRRVGIVPSILVARATNMRDEDLLSADEVVLLQDPGEAVPDALERCLKLGIHPHTLTWPGPPEEAAAIIAADCGARLVMQIGRTYSFSDVVKRGDKGISAAMLTRLRLGPRFADAETLRRLPPMVPLPAWAYGVLAVFAIIVLWLVGKALFGP